MEFCRLRHRGPDWSGLFVDEQACCYLSHERLAIIDPTSGDQPLYNGNKSIVVAVSKFLPPGLLLSPTMHVAPTLF
jgi:asparagine synthetase B (glutamine-hydrolysing)